MGKIGLILSQRISQLFMEKKPFIFKLRRGKIKLSGIGIMLLKKRNEWADPGHPFHKFKVSKFFD